VKESKADKLGEWLADVTLAPMNIAQGRGVVARLLAMTLGAAATALLMVVTLPLLVVCIVWGAFDDLGEPRD
jgi:hypothetical protein